MENTDIIFGSDHGGYRLKEILKDHFSSLDYNIHDIGSYNDDSVDYPEYAYECCKKVMQMRSGIGVLICGSGIGMSISANKINGIRAALCTSEYHARMARMHNDANIICLGERFTAPEYAIKILEVFLNTGFEGSRHIKRLNLIKEIETKNL